MGALIVAGIIFALALAWAVLNEMARGMAAAPSMHPNNFWWHLIPGTVLAALVAATHWLPHIGW